MSYSYRSRYCDKSFKTASGLTKHRDACGYYKHHEAEAAARRAYDAQVKKDQAQKAKASMLQDKTIVNMRVSRLRTWHRDNN